jgi:Cu+-exporting ATPase
LEEFFLKKEFLVSGMHCNSCAQLIEIELEELPGVKSAKVDFALQKAVVDFDEAKLNGQKIIDAIKKAGYSAKTSE